MLYLYRRGNGNDGNYPRSIVVLKPTDNPFAALEALVASDFIAGRSVRRHIVRNFKAEGEADYGIHGMVLEGPKGEMDMGAAWLTASLDPITEEDAESYWTMYRNSLREALDRGAWKQYRARITS